MDRILKRRDDMESYSDNKKAGLEILKSRLSKAVMRESEKNAVLDQVEQYDQKISVYVDGHGDIKGFTTIPVHTTGKDIVKFCGVKNNFKSLYLGFPMNRFLSDKALEEDLHLCTDYIAVYDDMDCMLDRLLQIVRAFEEVSCGHCVFGYEGAAQLQMMLSDIAAKKGRLGDLDLILDLCSVMKNQTLCEVGSDLAETVVSALNGFRDEIEAHITKRTCRAAVCNRFLTYHILPDLCNGCTKCEDACEEDAILGKKKFIHVIDQDACTQCGDCLKTCENGAIVKTGAGKPAGPKKPIPCKK
jgi:NADH-quinone oxidoreductase subunit F